MILDGLDILREMAKDMLKDIHDEDSGQPWFYVESEDAQKIYTLLKSYIHDVDVEHTSDLQTTYTDPETGMTFVFYKGIRPYFQCLYEGDLQ